MIGSHSTNGWTRLIAIDTNVLVHAHWEDSPKHRLAHARVVALAEAPSPWGIPVFCIGEFVRIITHPKIFDPPYTAEEACGALARLLASPSAVVLCPGSEYPVLLSEAIRESDAIGNLVFDAQIVALCREWGISRLLTEDRDFDRFKKLKIERL